MRGFLTNEALVVGVESRTSTPVRIPRDAQTLMHPEVAGLFPAGEGPGMPAESFLRRSTASVSPMRCKLLEKIAYG